MHWCQLRIGSQAVWTSHCRKLSPGQGCWRLSVPNALQFRGYPVTKGELNCAVSPQLLSTDFSVFCLFSLPLNGRWINDKF